MTCGKSERAYVVPDGNPLHHAMLGHDQENSANTLVILDQHIGCIYHLHQISPRSDDTS